MNPDSTVESVQGRILAGLETVHKHWGYFLASGTPSWCLTIALACTVFTTLASAFWVWSGAPHPA